MLCRPQNGDMRNSRALVWTRRPLSGYNDRGGVQGQGEPGVSIRPTTFAMCDLGVNHWSLAERRESTGRPLLGPKRFVVMLEKALARVLRPRKRGRRPRQTG